MAVMYFYKFNINSKIYDVYENESLLREILIDVYEKISQDMEIEVKERIDGINKKVKYKFCDLVKNPNNYTITGRLVRIFDGITESYDEKKDTVVSEYDRNKASSATFFFDVMREESAFITRRLLGYKQFGRSFTQLLEKKFDEGSFELIIEKNVGVLKEKIENLSKVYSVESELIPPNANDKEFKTLFGPTEEEFRHTKATKYTQKLEVSKKSSSGIDVKNTFLQRLIYAAGKAYAKIIVKGINDKNETVSIDSDEDAPYKEIIDTDERDSLTGFPEIAHKKISILCIEKMKLRMVDEVENGGEEIKG